MKAVRIVTCTLLAATLEDVPRFASASDRIPMTCIRLPVPDWIASIFRISRPIVFSGRTSGSMEAVRGAQQSLLRLYDETITGSLNSAAAGNSATRYDQCFTSFSTTGGAGSDGVSPLQGKKKLRLFSAFGLNFLQNILRGTSFEVRLFGRLRIFAESANKVMVPNVNGRRRSQLESEGPKVEPRRPPDGRN
jgi:hypothetical protein